MRLLIRQEEGGEVSTYLHRLPEQSTIELRGPNTELKLPRDIIEVVFLAGGTGIAPAMQVAQALGRRTGSRMHILWANRRREECIGGISDDKGNDASVQSRVGWWRSFFGFNEPAAQAPRVEDASTLAKGILVKELDALKKRSEAATRGLSINYYVDDEKTFIQPNDVERRIRRQREETGSRLIILSGPDGFIEHWAGKKLWANGREVQGPLGGQLARMDLGEWKVIKL
jgi:ferredoxin-NADP reductase